MVGAEVLGRRPMASNGVIEHTAESDTVDHSGLHAKSNNPARVLIHDDQDPVPSGKKSDFFACSHCGVSIEVNL